MYKAVHGHALNYVKELIKFKKPGKYNLRSNSDNLLLEIEKVKTYTTLGDRAFQVAAPKLWNNLPFNIRSSLFLPSFKKALIIRLIFLEKHFLKYFNCLHDEYNFSWDIKASFYFLCYSYNFN